MTKVAEVVNKSASLIMVRAAEQPLTGDEAESFIELLNDLMTEWEAIGVPLGYTLVQDLGDEMTSPDSALRAIKYNLAVSAAPEFGKDAPRSVLAIADSSFRNLERQVVKPPSAEFPGTLPVGSGTACTESYKYFPEPEAGLLDETEGSILLEENTGD